MMAHARLPFDPLRSAPVAQRIEHLTTDQEVESSNLSGRTHVPPYSSSLDEVSVAMVLMHTFIIASDCVGFTLPGMKDELGSHVPWAATSSPKPSGEGSPVPTAHPDHSCPTVSEFATDELNASIGYDLPHVHLGLRFRSGLPHVQREDGGGGC